MKIDYDTFTLLIAMLTPLTLAIGGYVAVKSDLAVTRRIAEDARAHAGEAHERIDAMLFNGAKK